MHGSVFPMLPLKNFDNTSLLSIDNAIGRAVKVDRNTDRGKRQIHKSLYGVESEYPVATKCHGLG